MAYGGARRISGRALLGGFGLLGLVITIGLMAMLAVRVLDSSPATATDDSSMLETLGRAAPVDPSDAPAPRPMAGVDAAQQAVCETDRSTLELASSVFATLNGAVPADQAELVAEGLLDGEIATHRLEPAGGSVVIVGIGDCATP